MSNRLLIINETIWLAILLIAVLKIIAYIIGAVKYHKFVALHTYLNKITGLLLFCLVYLTQIFSSMNVVYGIISLVAVMAALEELVINITSKQYNPDIKSAVWRRD